MNLAVRLVVVAALVCGAVGAALVAFAQPAPSVGAFREMPLPRETPRATLAIPTNSPGPRLRVAPLLPSVMPPTDTPPPSNTPLPTDTPPPTATRLPQVALASFAINPGDMRHNIEVALNANGGALRHVLVAPGTTFSFNAALGPRPTRLPWRNVGRTLPSPTPPRALAPAAPARFSAFQEVTPTAVLPDSPFAVATAAPAAPAAPTAEQPAPSATIPPTPEQVFVLGGGVCDLASRYVVAGRKLLPGRAFHFRQHPGGVSGVKRTDAVSIWATGGGPSDNDLLVTNTSPYYLVFEAHIDHDLVTVLAWFQEGP